jgi:CheY-like chemotaxis protein
MMSPKPRVLIVDDNAANRIAFSAVLDKDFAVVVAETGEEAVQICRNQAFAVIVLDVRMPGMDGFDTAEALRRREETQVTPIVFTSAYDQTLAQMTRGYVAGATDFLFSPVEADLLKLKVATYAQIYLRHEALRIKVRELNDLLQALQTDLSRRGMSSTRLRLRLRDLEATASEIHRQTTAVI